MKVILHQAENYSLSVKLITKLSQDGLHTKEKTCLKRFFFHGAVRYRVRNYCCISEFQTNHIQNCIDRLITFCCYHSVLRK